MAAYTRHLHSRYGKLRHIVDKYIPMDLLSVLLYIPM